MIIPFAEGQHVLEGLYLAGEGPEAPGAVVAPPHPLMGGSMDHPVVSEVAGHGRRRLAMAKASTISVASCRRRAFSSKLRLSTWALKARMPLTMRKPMITSTTASSTRLKPRCARARCIRRRRIPRGCGT